MFKDINQLFSLIEPFYEFVPISRLQTDIDLKYLRH